MMGLVVKDFLYLRKMALSYAVVIVIYFCLSSTGGLPVSALAGALSMLAAMLPFTIFAYDQQAKWDVYGLALPINRARAVVARYLTVLLLTLATLALALVMGLAAALLGKTAEGWAEYIVSMLACIAISMVLNAILLPLLYRFGAERARLMLFAVIGVLALLGVIFFRFLDGTQWLRGLGQMSFSPVQVGLFAAGVAGTGLVLLAMSLLLSVHFYRRREM